MRQITTREKVLLGIGVIALIAFLMIFFIVLPLQESAAGLNRKGDDLRKKLTDASVMYAHISVTERQIEEIQAKLKDITRPEGKSGPAMLREIELLTLDTGARLISLRPGEPQQATPGCAKSPTTFEVESNFSQLVKLLYELEQPRHRLWVEGVTISPGNIASNEVRATINVAMYTLPGQAEENDAED